MLLFCFLYHEKSLINQGKCQHRCPQLLKLREHLNLRNIICNWCSGCQLICIWCNPKELDIKKIKKIFWKTEDVWSKGQFWGFDLIVHMVSVLGAMLLKNSSNQRLFESSVATIISIPPSKSFWNSKDITV